MGKYEYKVLPTPRRAKRAKGVKGEPARFAHALTEMMNVEAAEGWEYLKSETLPMEAKSGMFKGVRILAVSSRLLKHLKRSKPRRVGPKLLQLLTM